MILETLLGCAILGSNIILGILLYKGKSININITHTHVEPEKPQHSVPNVDALQKEYEAKLPKGDKDPVNMEGIIMAVNEVMGIDTTKEDNR